MDYHLQQC